MSEVIWKKGKPKVIFTKEEKRKIRREVWKENKWNFIKGAIIGFCISFFGWLLIRLLL